MNTNNFFFNNLARVDPHLLFVLLSKFDMDKWLQLNKPKLIDISNLIQLILKGMELWNYQNSELLQDLLTCHLIKLFEHNFPEHYGDILQNVLMAFSNKRLKPNVLVHVLNSFYRKVGAKKLENTMDYFKLKEDFRNFASKQNILLYNDVGYYFYNYTC